MHKGRLFLCCICILKLLAVIKLTSSIIMQMNMTLHLETKHSTFKPRLISTLIVLHVYLLCTGYSNR